MKIVILGCDGYIGFPLSLRCLEECHEVIGIDNFSRRDEVKGIGSISATDINFRERDKLLKDIGNYKLHLYNVVDSMSIIENDLLNDVDVIVNLAHNPSAPHSMIDVDHSSEVLTNNIIGTNEILWSIKKFCPDAHYITIGSTGEYDHTIGVDIEESYFTFNHKNRTSKKCLFPRQGNSIYHCSKIASTYIIDYLARIWNLRCTDVMQSVVYGLYTPECDKYESYTRFDSDECFGTVLNRFAIQSLLGEPLTVYGEGKHQRAFLSLNDSIQALMIAINNPAKKGVVQTWNQLSEWMSINQLVDIFREVCFDNDMQFEVSHLESPRHEFTGEHYYNYITDNLKDKGYKPTRQMKQEIQYIFDTILLSDNMEDILRQCITPKVIF